MVNHEEHRADILESGFMILDISYEHVRPGCATGCY